MKITFARNLQFAATTNESTVESVAEKGSVANDSVNPKPVAQLPKKNVLPTTLSNPVKAAIPNGLGQTIPGMRKGVLPEGMTKNGFPGPGSELPGFNKSGVGGAFGKQGLPGMPGNTSSGIEGLLGAFGKNGLPGVGGGMLGNGKGPDIGGLGSGELGGFGKNGLAGIGKDIFGNGRGPGLGGFGSGEGDSGMGGLLGFGSKKGPAIRMPGSDRMDGPPEFNGGDSYGAIFGRGTWDFGSNGLSGTASVGATSHGYGVGVNDKGDVGVAKGDHNGGSVTSPADAQGAANSAVKGGSNKNSGTPEGLNWSKGTHVKDNTTKDAGTQPNAEPKKQEGPNDLGPSNNDPSKEQKKENETAVAQNDTTKHTQAGKPNPYAMPNPEDGGGGTPRSNAAHSSVFVPNPEDSGGGSPRSHGSSHLFMPNPEDSGGGTPSSVIANVVMKLRA